jgi:hypothetical protein
MLPQPRTKDCPDCGLVISNVGPHICQYGRLMAVLDAIPLSSAELLTVKWLAGREVCTVNSLIRILEKCRDAIDCVPMQ